MKTTATSGKGVHRILPALAIAAADYQKRVPTGALNRAIRDLQVKQPAPTGKIRYAVQGRRSHRPSRCSLPDACPDVPALRRTIAPRAILPRLAATSSTRSD